MIHISSLEWFDNRNLLMFCSDSSNFLQNCTDMMEKYSAELSEATADRQNDIAQMLGELAVDLQSYIAHWYLRANNNKAAASEAQVQTAVIAIYDVLSKYGREDVVNKAKADAQKVKDSNLFKLSCKTDTKELNNRIGNDAYYGLTDSMRRGCALVTTNPVMVNAACRDMPQKYAPVRDEIRKENPDASQNQLVMMMTTEIVYENCYELYPVFKATKGEYGYVSLQVNPNNANDSVAMFEEVDYIYSEIQRRFGEKPNLVFKIPATEAALSTVSEMTKKGIGVNITASCTVSQHIATAKVIEEGNAQVSFITMMSGRLDDRIAEELSELGIKDAQEISTLASGLVMGRSYDILYNKLGYKRSRLLTASVRGAWNVEASLTHGPSCVYVSLFPPESEKYDEVPRENVSTMSYRPDAETMKILLQSEIFRKAYNPEDLDAKDFYQYFPVRITLEAFCEKYNDTMKFMNEDS